jgi:hypothetical protein
MLTGRVPFTAETPYAVVYKHVQDPPPSARALNPSLSEELELVLLKCLAKNPGERYQNANAFVRAVRQAIPDSPAAENTLVPQSTSVIPGAEGENAKALEKQSVGDSGSRNRVSSRVPIWLMTGIGVIGLAVILGAVMRSRSNALRPETVAPSIVSTDTPALLSSPTAIVTAAPQPVVSAPGTPFRDDFENQLAEGWTWLAEDQARWSLTEVPGWLQILASDASFDGPSFPTNILLREAPAGDFELTTLLRFTPSSNFQFAGLVVFQDKANVLQFGRGFCDLPDSCVGNGIYFDNFEGGFIVSNHKTTMSGASIHLRLQRLGNLYIGSFSEDGANWVTLGEHNRDLSQVRVGVLAAQAAQEIPAAFDYFTMTSLTE